MSTSPLFIVVPPPSESPAVNSHQTPPPPTTKPPTTGGPLECLTCHKKFRQKAGLVRHSKLHTNTTPFACHACPRAFTRADHLKKHVRIHTGEKPYKCAFCPERYIQSVHLTQHVERMHPGEVVGEELSERKSSRSGRKGVLNVAVADVARAGLSRGLRTPPVEVERRDGRVAESGRGVIWSRQVFEEEERQQRHVESVQVLEIAAILLSLGA
ncbi:hypothetical protein HDU98_009849 [Podochytrium sp. JEL0797]|nr:hypothetical protein HDU98_009849 [Podochytrium sp. JEL0797]